MEAEKFKAWFEGFSENIGDQPSKHQWERIREKVRELGAPNGASSLGFPRAGELVDRQQHTEKAYEEFRRGATGIDKANGRSLI